MNHEDDDDYQTKMQARDLHEVEADLWSALRSIKTLTAIINEYRAMNSELRCISTMAAYDRDRARDIAARLEAECAQCWGPVHTQLLNSLRLGESGELDTNLSEYLDSVVGDDVP